MSHIFARGTQRLLIDRLPCLDRHACVRYAGSISKAGDNADWDWGMYEDENGEWVLMEADGAGCIYNFTQHRYPSSPTPIFRFYFDDSKEAQFTITPADFGTKPPFLAPLADAFIGPEDDGRGPIRVVRSFFPMEFCTHCRVTSSIRLTGCEKSKGEGGWGHITYQLYDTADELVTFPKNKPDDTVYRTLEDPLSLPFDETISEKSFRLSPKEKKTLCLQEHGTLTEICIDTATFSPEYLSTLWLSLSFDGIQTVCAPFGTFFGCEYGETPAKIETALLTADFSGKRGLFSNRFPMPFFSSATVTIENRSETTIAFDRLAVSNNRQLCYNPAETGYFSASPYYPKTANTPGQNSIIADLDGCGQMVYGVISGEAISRGGCEGDVRVFIDGSASPTVQADGSESWSSYGWGFVCPPQCNPFSAYHGIPHVNHTWSEQRLTFTDSYFFRSRLRFELEHGDQNDGGGFHSGQVFCYMQKTPCETEISVITPFSDTYSTDGTVTAVHDRFENGIHTDYQDFFCVSGMTFSSFTVAIPPENDGIVLKRVCKQEKGQMCAQVRINGQRVTERDWLYPDCNPIYALLEDSFTIPAAYTRCRTQITVELRPQDSNWSECRYRIFAIRTGE